MLVPQISSHKTKRDLSLREETVLCIRQLCEMCSEFIGNVVNIDNAALLAPDVDSPELTDEQTTNCGS